MAKNESLKPRYLNDEIFGRLGLVPKNIPKGKKLEHGLERASKDEHGAALRLKPLPSLRNGMYFDILR